MWIVLKLWGCDQNHFILYNQSHFEDIFCFIPLPVLLLKLAKAYTMSTLALYRCRFIFQRRLMLYFSSMYFFLQRWNMYMQKNKNEKLLSVFIYIFRRVIAPFHQCDLRYLSGGSHSGGLLYLQVLESQKGTQLENKHSHRGFYPTNHEGPKP